MHDEGDRKVSFLSFSAFKIAIHKVNKIIPILRISLKIQNIKLINAK